MQEGEAAGFSRFSAQKRKLTTQWQAGTAGWSTKEGRAARKVSKRLARRKLRRNDGKGPSVPRKKDENAVAAAMLVFSQGGRKSVDFCGRQAQTVRHPEDGEDVSLPNCI